MKKLYKIVNDNSFVLGSSGMTYSYSGLDKVPLRNSSRKCSNTAQMIHIILTEWNFQKEMKYHEAHVIWACRPIHINMLSSH